jgi:integrase
VASIDRRVAPSGEVSYRVRIRVRGRPPQTASFRRLTDAKRWAQQTEVEVRAGRHLTRLEAERHTLTDLVARYERDVLADFRPNEKRVRRGQLQWWVKRLGPYSLAEITPARIVEVRDELRHGGGPSGKGVSRATCNRYLAALSHVFTMAVREFEWCSENPVVNVRRLQEPRGRVRFLDEEERSALLDACKSGGDRRLYPLVLLAISTGARQGELLGLRWRDVDLARRVAVLHHTKNKDRRALPLAEPAIGALEELRKVRRLDSDLVFAGRKGQALFPRKAFGSALARAGIVDFRFHDLRHTAASYLAMSGATLAEIAEILGHRTLAMVKRYAHLTDAHTAGVVERMNARFLG